jgi:hypothetical protein
MVPTRRTSLATVTSSSISYFTNIEVQNVNKEFGNLFFFVPLTVLVYFKPQQMTWN